MTQLRMMFAGVNIPASDPVWNELRDKKLPFEFAASADDTMDSLFQVPVDILVMDPASLQRLESRITIYRQQHPHTIILVCISENQTTPRESLGIADGVIWRKLIPVQMELAIRQYHIRNRLLEVISNQQTALDQQRKSIEDMNVKLESWITHLEGDFSLINQIQEKWIPKRFPQIKSIQFQGYYVTGQKLGGDFFDVFSLPNRHEIGIIQLDSVGHSVTSALLTTLLKLSVGIQDETRSEALDFLVDSIRNNLVPVLEKTSKILNLRVGVLDPRKLTFEFCDFGMEQLFYYQMNQNQFIPCELAKNAVFSAEHVHSEFVRHKMHLSPGDFLFLPSDGCQPFMPEMLETLSNKLDSSLLELRNELAFHIKPQKEALHDDASFLLLRVDDRALQLIN